jgi:hypothetical protein
MSIGTTPVLSDYKVRALNKIRLHNEITLNFGVPDSFALMQDRFVAVQYKQKKLIQIYALNHEQQNDSNMQEEPA